MIVTRSISKSFGKLRALSNISLNCGPGQSMALIGPNGSGKTTLIKCLLGMVMPDSGFIAINGINIAKNWRYREHIGYMPQIGRYPDNMTIAQLLEMMKDIRKPDHPMDEELIDTLGLRRIMNKSMRTLSGGTRQKVSAALAFLFKPPILILDEPTAGLDPLSSELLKEKIGAEKEKGRLILITSHILSDLEDIITSVIYLEEGALVFHKSLDQLREDTGEQRLAKAVARIMQKHSTT